jgi:hypothetical protein
MSFPRDGAEPGGVLRRPQARRARRVRGGGRHDHKGVGGCNRNAVHQPDEAPALGARRRRWGAVPVVRGGRLQGRPEQVSRLPLPPQGLRGALQDARHRRHRPRDALLPAVQQVYSSTQASSCSSWSHLSLWLAVYFSPPYQDKLSSAQLPADLRHLTCPRA